MNKIVPFLFERFRDTLNWLRSDNKDA